MKGGASESEVVASAKFRGGLICSYEVKINDWGLIMNNIGLMIKNKEASSK